MTVPVPTSMSARVTTTTPSTDTPDPSSTTDKPRTITVPTLPPVACKPVATSTPVPALATINRPTPATITPATTTLAATTATPTPMTTTTTLAPTTTAAPTTTSTLSLVSVCKDATYGFPTSTVGTTPICGGDGCSTGATRCPRKGDVPVAGCNPGIPSWNASSKMCVAPEDAVCGLVTGSNQTGGTWGCMFPSQGCATAPATTASGPGTWVVPVVNDTSYAVASTSKTLLCGGTGVCAPQGTLCPKQGTVSSGAPCSSNLPSWNAATGTCIAPNDAVCTYVARVWQCQFRPATTIAPTTTQKVVIAVTKIPTPTNATSTTVAPTTTFVPVSTLATTTRTAVPIVTASNISTPTMTPVPVHATTTLAPSPTPIDSGNLLKMLLEWLWNAVNSTATAASSTTTQLDTSDCVPYLAMFGDSSSSIVNSICKTKKGCAKGSADQPYTLAPPDSYCPSSIYFGQVLLVCC
ncbi:hypothetical protein H257_18703 [Aphanomyces astaci]|uniref:CBM1 domain-containing protein n=1 Tax=Aphanomyces astaci TaxID=112090 RepID=W4FAB1_APHAT|nr:hypothetical protein H257_18703 [Aphanomyces astaci]ETV64397.1 hypothetical protein H257_18703 [Aphanomyces astaci]|eukprot:XP_009846122.1 hypothetical protein H257_18703 [Aphanomyces astaci]